MFLTENEPLIVTAELDEASFQFFNALRQKHFPPERNFIDAHLTLFHHLPGDLTEKLIEELEEMAANLSPIELRYSSWRSLGRGVAMNVESSDLTSVSRTIAEGWTEYLTPQDKQPFRPHITVQNKVEPETAKKLLAELETSPLPLSGFATGLRISRYLGGPWETIQVFDMVNEIEKKENE